MATVQTRLAVSSLSADSRQRALDLVEVLFLVSVFLAPWDLSLEGSGFTAYDAVLVVVAFLTFVWRRQRRFLPFNFVAAAYVFLLFALLSTFRSPEPIQSLTQILQFVFIFFIQIPVILTLIKSQRMLHLSLLVFTVGMLAGTLDSLIFQRFQGAGRSLATYSDNANRLGYPTAWFLPFVLYLLFDVMRTRRWLGIILALPVFYLMTWGLAASGSRSAAVGTLVAAVVFLSFRHGFTINLRAMLGWLLVVVVIGLLFFWLFQLDLLPHTLSHRIELTRELQPSVIQDRTDLAEAGLLAFEESPFLGVGLDNFRYVAGQYMPLTYQVPHNMWIQFLAQVGLFGMLAFLVLIVEWFVLLVRTQRKINNRSQRELLWCIVASFSAILTIYMFVPLPIQRMYWLVFGLGLAMVSYVREEQTQTTER